MDNVDVVTFCQNEMPSISFAALEDMRKRGHLCDVTIKVRKHSFTAHRAILAAGIPYFQSVFSGNGMETGEREIAVEDLDPSALESLIHFAYTYKVDISLENAQSLLLASHFLQLIQVHNACVEFLSKRLNVGNVARLRAFACSMGNSDLIQSCNVYIRENFEAFSKSEDFLSLSHSCVKEIFSEDDLNVSSEEIVFEALMKWVNFSPSERQVTLTELLPEVRMTYLPIHYIIERVDSEELIMSSKLCRNLVNEVKSYHLLTDKRPTCSNLKTRPRCYFQQDLCAICACETCGYSVYQFDVLNDIWHNLATKKVRCGTINSVAAVNAKIYIFLDETIYTFCARSREWAMLEPTHEGIKGTAIVSNGNMIYCFGSQEVALRGTLRRFDTLLNEWLEEAKMKTRRGSPAAALLGDAIYVTGGYNGSKCVNTVEKYSPPTGDWSDVAPMHTARNQHGCTSLNNKIYVCGGVESDSTTLNTAEVYDSVTDQWSIISPMGNVCSSLTLVSHYNKIYALKDSDVEVYDPKNNRWNCCVSVVPGGFSCAVSMPSCYKYS